jgi:hypothetical protein
LPREVALFGKLSPVVVPRLLSIGVAVFWQDFVGTYAMFHDDADDAGGADAAAAAAAAEDDDDERGGHGKGRERRPSAGDGDAPPPPPSPSELTSALVRHLPVLVWVEASRHRCRRAGTARFSSSFSRVVC